MARGKFEYTTDKADNAVRKAGPRYVRAIQNIQSIGKVANDSQCQMPEEKIDKIERTLYEEVERTVAGLRAGAYAVAVAGL